ncbi:MAG: hypothetical protein HYT65_02650 [Candidatus Yanofskybacteria bacterium]|nr:hypothetical protein [Candidatus Yanofskybacteria bacterium]
MSKPYIGVVGVKNIKEAFQVADMLREAMSGRPDTHLAQVGVQVTTRTLHGEITESRRNPIVSEIPEIFKAAVSIKANVFPVVHFTTREHEKIPQFVDKILQLSNGYLAQHDFGLQLNGAFGKIAPEALASIRSKYPRLKLILQLHRKVLDTMPITDIVTHLKEMETLIDYVLIDPSGGRGEEMDVSAGAFLAKQIINQTPIAVGFAGGLRGDNVAKIVGELRNKLGMNNFSIDAEGGLRDKVGEGYGNDDFNIKKAQKYFINAVQAFSD